MYFYGYSNIRQDIYEMLGKPADNMLTRLIGPTAPLWGFCWKFISPTVGILITIFMLMRSELTVEHRSKIYRYPQWAVYFGYFLSLVPLVPIPVYFVVNAVKWTKEGSPLSSMFTIQPSLVSYNRVNGLAEFGIRPKDYEGEFTTSYASSSASTSVPSDITSPEALSS
ncbi:hypothetical protein GCK32_016824 [Trichostrongylus colubriformis]|uniref:Uncharacterized protein n=1 Tax=Trichostrongylus colubriformis TaxID=6319 RepID=A0AAN8EQI8_TRICO